MKLSKPLKNILYSNNLSQSETPRIRENYLKIQNWKLLVNNVQQIRFLAISIKT
jgi:hypothetical protein